MLQTSCVARSSELRMNFPGVLHACFLLVETFIFPALYSNRSKRPLRGADVYPWISNSNLSKQGTTDLEEHRCLLYSAAPVPRDRL